MTDEQARIKALHPQHSFIVQAPAGSGKTELITQRVLVLLAHVNAPEEILAITFTKKAAAEMRARIIASLKKARLEPEPTLPHHKKTWQLAKQALLRDESLNWNLLTNPNRLRIQTIDSFNASLIKHLPILSHFGAPPDITHDAVPLYREAVQEFLSHLEENVAWSDAIAQLLLHLDNDLNKMQILLINMLAKRDQWLPYIMIDADRDILREQLENDLASVVIETLNKIYENFPKQHTHELLTLARFAAHHLRLAESQQPIIHCLDLTELPAAELDDLSCWLGLSNLLLTNDFSWRKRFDKSLGFPAASSVANPEEKALCTQMKQRMTDLIEQFSEHEHFRLILTELYSLPAPRYQESQWKIVDALYHVLRIVVAQLKVVFQKYGKIDYIENAQAALFALGSDEAPTDLALALDYQIRHILIDEFQDTANSQYRLIQKLTAGWEPHDGRTLFVVGDPMQSIYRFREAEVGLFIRARKKGIAHIPLEPLTLSVNFRSTPTIVDWVNRHFTKTLPAFDNMATGAVSYSPSIANASEETSASTVELHALTETPDSLSEADAIVQLIQTTRRTHPQGSIAILVRSRTHLEEIIPALKKADIPYRAINIDPLNSRSVIQDMMALTRALLHPADRIAWLAILRAPWCGLSLADLLHLAGNHPHQTLWEQLNKSHITTQLSEEGQQRVLRILPILRSKIAERRRFPLRQFVEITWLALGGPACLEQSTDLDDVQAFFQLLETLDEGGDVSQLDQLDKQVSQLYAAPNNQSENALQIMTIHNAKGLEFDTVILPHLERKSPNDDKQLLLWMERPSENNGNALILAPVHAMGSESDSIYDYIKKQHSIKTDYELGRLLYVAATRAKKNLHLFFTLKKSEPITKSLLEKLWPAIKSDVMEATPSLAEEKKPLEQPDKSPRLIKRLSLNWKNPTREYKSEHVTMHQKNRGFELPDNTPRYIGTVTHQIFQQISRLGLDWWTSKSMAEHQLYLQQHLYQLGMTDTAQQMAIHTIQQAIERTLNDPRGRWILSSHLDAKAEFSLTALINQEIKTLIIDRTFIDEHNTRWIIDYKAVDYSLDNYQDITAFLKAEQKKYEKQMQQYYQAMQLIDTRPIRLALYFPVIPAWQEWSIDSN
jgi:ATP-dependent exoDNAse (exonuclease V) beta subunit